LSKVILGLASLLIMSAPAMASEMRNLRLCYTTLNEDIVTATAVVASEKNYLKNLGIQLSLKPIQMLMREHPLTEKELSGMNLGKDKSMAKYFRGYEAQDAQVINQLISGNCDLISISGEVVFFSKESEKIDFLLSYFYGLNYDTNLLVPTNSNIKDLKQLKGKKIRFGRFSTYFAMKEILNSVGLKPTDVEMKFVKIADLEKNLQDKKVDAAIVYNPTAPLLLAKGSVKVLEEGIFHKFYKNIVPSYSLATSKDFMQKAENKKLLRDFLTAYKKASEISLKNPEEIIYALQKSASVKQEAYKTYNVSAVQVEKAAEIMKIMPPFFYVEEFNVEGLKADITAQKVEEVYSSFQKDLLNEHFIEKKLPIDFVKIKKLE